MTQSNYYRGVVRSFNIVTIAAMAAVSCMWLATALDHLLGLGWGWDKPILWVAPAIIAIAFGVRFVGFAIYRAIGALPPR